MVIKNKLKKYIIFLKFTNFFKKPYLNHFLNKIFLFLFKGIMKPEELRALSGDDTINFAL